jgi:hypothetical protein
MGNRQLKKTSLFFVLLLLELLPEARRTDLAKANPSDTSDIAI